MRLLDRAPHLGGDDGERDRLALADVYRAHANDVARWAARLAGPGFDVEDIVHEVFLVAQRRLPAFRGGAHLRTWLYRTTAFVVKKRRYRDRWRRWLGGSARDVAEHIPSTGPTPLEHLERRRRDQVLYQVLDGLPEKYRSAIIMFDLEGLSGEEVATLTGRKVATLRVWLFRARTQFMQRLRAIEGERAGG